MKLFEINPEHCIHIEQKLFYNIYALLCGAKFEKKDTLKYIENPQKVIECKSCGGQHHNTGEWLACARAKKKELLQNGKGGKKS